jgi:IPTL-CTERM motif
VAVNIGSPSFGGNLCVFKGQLILERSTLSDGFAATGGGLYLDSLTEDSTILSSTISGNQGFEVGGGIVTLDLAAALTIESSTISGNIAGFPEPNPDPDLAFGGGLYLGNDNVRIINSTISGNHAFGFGGGIVFFSGSHSLLLRLTTILNNVASRKGGSILAGGVPPATVQLDHAIVANGAPEDLAVFQPGPLSVTANYSLVEAPGDAVLVGANNLVGVDPLLGPLANNGGPTLTHRPLPGSPVIDAGNPAIPSPPATDQRGFARIFGAAVDLGSVEARPELIEIPTLSHLGLLALAALLGIAGLWHSRRAARPIRPCSSGVLLDILGVTVRHEVQLNPVLQECLEAREHQ